MILGHSEIGRRLDELFPDIKPYKIGAASADVRIGNRLITELGRQVELSAYPKDHPFILTPGDRILVDMLERVTLPVDVSAMFTLKSTRGREGYNHAVAGWVDPGWRGILTMELKNDNQVKVLPIYTGMPIGQLIFMLTIDGGQYRGRYQDSDEVSAARKEIPYNV